MLGLAYGAGLNANSPAETTRPRQKSRASAVRSPHSSDVPARGGSMLWMLCILLDVLGLAAPRWGEMVC